MTLEPLLTSPLAIQVHVAAVTAAFFTGGWVIYFSRKGSPGHRVLGVLFLALMTAAVIASLFIHRSMPGSPVFGLSPTHLFVPLVLVMVWLSVRSAMKGNIKLHRFCVKGLFMGGLVANGLINLALTHGVIHQSIFTSPPHLEASASTPAQIRGDTRS